MSTLSVNNLQGLSPTNKVTVPSGHKLSCESGRYRLPNYSSGNKPSNAETGELIINTTTATLEMWTVIDGQFVVEGIRGATKVTLQTLQEMHMIRETLYQELYGSQYLAVEHINLNMMQLIVMVQVTLVGLNMMLHSLEQIMLP